MENEVKSYVRSMPPGYEKFRGDRSPYGKSFASTLPACDVVHLHWVSGFFDFSALPRVAARAPVVWTLHDMNAFTGGCHYAGTCGGFRDGCGRCPQLGSESSSDLSHQVLQRKMSALRSLGADDLHLVTPSRWLSRQAQASAVFGGRSCEVIPYGLDTKVFRPRDRRAARAEFGIGATEKVVLFVAESVGVRRKGMTILLEALGHLKQSDLHLLTVGYGSCEFPEHLKVTQLGPIHDDARMSLAYSSADAFACPSLEDNFPNTVLEAMACGVPVVGFDVGGIPEMVSDGETGFLAPAGDVGALADAIERILGNDNWEKLAAACRERVEQQFDLRTQGKRYLQLYQNVIR
jgi:glycosyltransferase involved in cell wall biosynthesis